MESYSITAGLYLYPTPAGAYYAICSREDDATRSFICNLFAQPVTNALTLEHLQHLMNQDDPQLCYELLLHCQNMNWVQGLTQERKYPSDLLENILPDLLKPLSESGKIILADRQGFYLSSYGFSQDIAEELAALSAELASVHERRPASLMKVMGITSHAWAMIDVFGNSQLGFWPLFIGENRFVLVIAGVPHFNQPEFVDLIWALSKRYADFN